MKCPLLSLAPYAVLDPSHTQLIECLKEECAWWDEGLACCFIRSISYRLGGIANSLRDIASKTPQGGGQCT